MASTFEKGSDSQPKGHALLYFSSSSDASEVWATYVVILPVTVDVTKYVPPFLMNQVGDIGPKDLSCFAFPPAPERMSGKQEIEWLAETRGDDLLYGGVIDASDVGSSMMAVTNAVQSYADLYTQHVEGSQPQSIEAAGAESEGLGVTDVMYGLMSDSDKLNELTKLVGRLRFAVDVSDENVLQEAEQDIGIMARHLPDNHRIDDLVLAAKKADSSGPVLADLYLKRCFLLIQQEYASLGQLEDRIHAIESGQEPS